MNTAWAPIVALFLWAGCSADSTDIDSPDTADAAVLEGGSATVDAGEDAAPSYAGSFTLNQLASVQFEAAAGEPYVQSLQLDNGVGSIGFQGHTWPAAIANVIPFAPYDLAAIVATTDTGIVVTYAYCKENAVVGIYVESLEVPDRYQETPGGGTCAIGTTAGTVDVALQKPAGEIVYGPFADAADVDAPGLSVHGGTGTLVVDDVAYDLAVFTDVDCAACGGAGWRELHVTLRKDERLAFAILYLEASAPTQIDMYYGFRFDEPSHWPPDARFDGTWALK